jgi:tagatose-6-phosphate ketose/aldose isomerase
MPYGYAENEHYGIVPFVVVGQLLGYYASLAHGLNPDAPSVSGNIHRVVEGVTIYE